MDLDLKKMAASSIERINRLADDMLQERAFVHEFVMLELEWQVNRKNKEQILKQCFHPYGSVEAWWESQSFDEQYLWRELYQRYQYGPMGASLIDEYDFFTMAVMNMDSYQQQPFCPHCDSRGHASGECMR